MLLRFATAVVFVASLSALSQQATANAPEPEYRDQYTVLMGGRLVPLERETAMTDTQSRRNFVITPNTKVFESIPHTASPLRVPPGIHFFVKASVGDRDPSTVIHLHSLVAGKKDRRIPIITFKQSLIPFGGVKHERAEDDSIAFTVQKYGAGSLEIIPSTPLPPGEYAFVNGHEAQCFGVDAGLSTPVGGGEPAPTAAATRPAAPPPPEWRMRPVDKSNPNDEKHVAVLPGTVEANGKRGMALLSIGCNIFHYTAQQELRASLPVELQVRRELVTFNTEPFSCVGDGVTGSPSVYTEVGTQSIAARNACFDEQLPADPRESVTFGLSYEDAVVKSIMDASGGALTVRIRVQPSGTDDLIARFPLPQTASAVQSMIAPCVELLEAEHKREQDSIVASCPVIAGKTLSDVTVLVGPTLKKLSPDPDNDIGTAWNLPKSTKAHPVRPKLALACNYKSPAGPAEMIERKTLPIPVIANSCTYRQDEYTNIPYGDCTR